MKRVIKWTIRLILLALLGLASWLFYTYWTSTNNCDQSAVAPTNPMKAIVSCEYGAANLQLRELEKPAPLDNEVLVRVRAASINPVDGHMIRGSWLMRPMSGMRNQRIPDSEPISPVWSRQLEKMSQPSSPATKFLARRTGR